VSRTGITFSGGALEACDPIIAKDKFLVSPSQDCDRKPRRGIECEPLHTALRPFGITYWARSRGAHRAASGRNPSSGHGSSFTFTLPVSAKEEASPV
jgi:hypothetical protein